MRVARPGDFWSGLVLAGLGAYIVVEARHWVYNSPDGPGAGFFPLWYGLAMVALSVVLVLRSVRGSTAAQERIAWPETRRAFACWAALVVAVPLLKWAGFIVTFALLTWFIVAVMFRRPQLRAWSIAIAGALLFYLVFDVGLGVSLPPGLWR